MIFDRIDIFVVCIILGSCLCIAEAFLGIWDEFAYSFVITLLAIEVCYTLRCNEKLKKELIEANWRRNDTEKVLDAANKRCAWRQKLIDIYSLLVKKRNAQFECEHAKVNYCKHRITLRQLIDAMNHADKECGEISDKISELTKELNELYAKK